MLIDVQDILTYAKLSKAAIQLEMNHSYISRVECLLQYVLRSTGLWGFKVAVAVDLGPQISLRVT